MCHCWWEESGAQASCFISFLLITLLNLGIIAQVSGLTWPEKKKKVLIVLLSAFLLGFFFFFFFLMKRRTHSGGLFFLLWLVLLDSCSFSSCILVVLLSCSVVPDYLRPHGLQHARLPCLSLSPGVCSHSCPLNQWCHPIILSSVVPFSSCLQCFPASGSFPMSRLFV